MTTGYPKPIDAPSPELLQRCVHCGFCLPTCPTYAVLGVEMDSPRGRIRLMETVWGGRVDVTSHGFQKHIDQCLDCRACETACPSGVEYGKLVEGAAEVVRRGRCETRARGAVHGLRDARRVRGHQRRHGPRARAQRHRGDR